MKRIKLTKYEGQNEPEVRVSGDRVELNGAPDELVFQLALALYAIKDETGWSTADTMLQIVTALGAIVAVEEEKA